MSAFLTGTIDDCDVVRIYDHCDAFFDRHLRTIGIEVPNSGADIEQFEARRDKSGLLLLVAFEGDLRREGDARAREFDAVEVERLQQRFGAHALYGIKLESCDGSRIQEHV